MKTNTVYYDKDKGIISKRKANKNTIVLQFTENGYDFEKEQPKYKLSIKTG